MVRNVSCTSQVLLASDLFGGIADKCKLLKNEADEPLSEILSNPKLRKLVAEDGHEQVLHAPEVDRPVVGRRDCRQAQLLKDEADEILSEIFEREADEASDCESDRLQHAAGSAVL